MATRPPRASTKADGKRPKARGATRAMSGPASATRAMSGGPVQAAVTGASLAVEP
jgi:hypothetical protein